MIQIEKIDLNNYEIMFKKPKYLLLFISKCCLAMDPNKRWSCDKLLDHPYFNNYSIDIKQDSKAKSYQAQNIYQNDRKVKQPGVSV